MKEENKGGKTVIIYLTDYIKNYELYLNDKQIYKKLDADPTRKRI